MTTKSINDRLGHGGLDSVAVLQENEAGVTTGLIDTDGSPLGVPIRLAQNYTAISRVSENTAADTSFQTLTTRTLPGNTMGLHSKLVIIPEWDYNASASYKIMSVDFGATNISGIEVNGASLPTYRMGKILLEIQNLGSLAIQKTMNGSSYGISPNARLSSAIDTTQDVVITFKVRWNAATLSETITLVGYSIWHFPGDE